MRHSFRGRLFGAFLIVSLVPLLVCSAMLLQIFRLRMTGSVRQEMAEQLSAASHVLDTAFDAIEETAQNLRENPILARALAGAGEEDTLVYNELFEGTSRLRGQARLDLYDREGGWRYSTELKGEDMPTDWGALYSAAGRGEALRYAACEDAAADAPLLQGAAVLYGGEEEPAGYLVVSLYDSHLRQLLEGTYGSQNDLVLLSSYFRPVYCVQPSLARELAASLRERLLAGQALDEASEGFIHGIVRNESSGLYLVLRRPQVFTQETMRLLYTVSLTCAVVCVAISVLMSLKLSRQMFRPIDRLHRGIGEVVQNNLDVCVTAEADDELGELAQRFNGMVAALKRNQQALVANQRELNQAQIRMLQAQLNPHFLCNTLDTMKWISKINKVPQVALMSTDLADILRFCISPDEFVPLCREAEILDRYIEIQRIRLSGAFTFSMDLPPRLEDCLIPKMILQPLVENAILHGLDGQQDGTVTVSVRQGDGMLRITVADNGKGFPPELAGGRYRGDASGRHLGLYNVDTILNKYYGGDCGLFLDNDAGAVVTAVLPVCREEEDRC